MVSDGGHVGPATTGRWLRKPRTGAQALADDPLESETEVFREQSINHRIDCRVAVTAPEDYREEHLIDAVLAERADEIKCEERKPAKDETYDDDGESLGRC